jgi:hypothetical protein
MGVLQGPKVWKKTRPATARQPDLSDEERAHLARALVFLRVKAGSSILLAKALGVSEPTITRGASDKRATASLALRVARLAGQPVDAVLAGAWPKEGACPHCGRD